MILPQSESFNLLKNRLKCVFYFNALPKVEKQPGSQEKNQFDAECQEIYSKFQKPDIV